jgi:menaquinone-dependent protoporphyrinogen oxidase
MVLVAYASKYGSTQEIAETIGRVMTALGQSAEICPADDVVTLEAYDAVVLGSAVYSGDWLVEAKEFLESFQDELKKRPLWLFSSGPTASVDPVEALGGWRYPERLEPLITQVKPRGITLFAGRIDADKLSLQDWLINRSMSGVVGDFRNWQQIEIWAGNIAQALAPQKLFPG